MNVLLSGGLLGAMGATIFGNGSRAAIMPIPTAAGYVRAGLDTDGETTQPKTQATRMLKCACEACD